LQGSSGNELLPKRAAQSVEFDPLLFRKEKLTRAETVLSGVATGIVLTRTSFRTSTAFGVFAICFELLQRCHGFEPSRRQSMRQREAYASKFFEVGIYEEPVLADYACASGRGRS